MVTVRIHTSGFFKLTRDASVSITGFEVSVLDQTLKSDDVFGSGNVGLVVRVLVVLDLLPHVGDVQMTSVVTDLAVVQRLDQE